MCAVPLLLNSLQIQAKPVEPVTDLAWLLWEPRATADMHGGSHRSNQGRKAPATMLLRLSSAAG